MGLGGIFPQVLVRANAVYGREKVIESLCVCIMLNNSYSDIFQYYLISKLPDLYAFIISNENGQKPELFT